MDFYFADLENITQESITLDRFEQKHITATMRKKIGDIIGIIDGKGNFYESRISDLRPVLKAEIIRKEKKAKPVFNLALAIAFIKPSRLEFILEKGTELGVNQFHIYRSRYANYSSDNNDRFTKKIRQALKQSQQYYLPEIYLYPSLQDYINQTIPIQTKFLAVNNTYPPLLNKLLKLDMNFSSKSIILAVGPEGGFSDEEINEFKSAEFEFVSLGSSRLRAETAAICGFSIMKTYCDHLIKGAV